MNYCIEILEREYAISEISHMRGSIAFDVKEGDELHNDLFANHSQNQEKWLRVLPDKSRMCYGCNFFRGCVNEDDQDEMYDALPLLHINF